MIRLLLLCALLGLPVASHADEPKPAVVFLVRHAEKAAAGKNPKLSPEGKARAKLLARALKDAKIKHVHSTGYTRTQDTAAPTAKAFGVETKTYDPSNLPALIDAIRHAGGTHLVVGHSNTTPTVVKLLGGDPGSPIDDKGEFDRLYIVTLAKSGEVQSTLLRYGPAFASP